MYLQYDGAAYVKASKVASAIDADSKTIINMIKNGVIRGKQIGRDWKVLEEDVNRLLDVNDTFGSPAKSTSILIEKADAALAELLAEKS